MEPFVTRDGNCLFFNSLNDGINTSLYYATKVTDTFFELQGEITGVNGTPPHLDAVASMDMQNEFYFVSTRNYPTVYENLQTGHFNNGIVTDVNPVKGDFYIKSPGWIVMDVEINKAGDVLYYVNAKFSGGSSPDEAIFGIALKDNSEFNKSSNSDYVLQNINNPDYLVYAACISSDGKEFFFTRIKKGILKTEICRSVRSNLNDPFSIPKVIKLSGDLIEAPTLTDDGKRLYFHKKLNKDGKHHIFTIKIK